MNSPSVNDDRLDRMEALLSRIDLAITGDGVRGVTGLVHTTQALHRRLDEVEKRTETVETTLKAERWYGRIGAGVVGAIAGGLFSWFKARIGVPTP